MTVASSAFPRHSISWNHSIGFCRCATSAKSKRSCFKLWRLPRATIAPQPSLPAPTCTWERATLFRVISGDIWHILWHWCKLRAETGTFKTRRPGLNLWMSLFCSTSCSLIQFPPAAVIDAVLTQPLTAAGGVLPAGLDAKHSPKEEPQSWNIYVYIYIYMSEEGAGRGGGGRDLYYFRRTNGQRRSLWRWHKSIHMFPRRCVRYSSQVLQLIRTAMDAGFMVVSHSVISR